MLQKKGDIALDDVLIKKGQCDEPDFFTINCDFEEENLCGYTFEQNTSVAQFKWLRNNGPTATPNTGPSFDATYNTEHGHYMYIRAAVPRVKGEKARLISPLEAAPSLAKCVTFWYHAYGADIGSLNVYSQLGAQESSSNPKRLLWTVNRNQGNSWYMARVSTDYSTNFRIIFEGVVGKSQLGDIAIDDVHASPKGCPRQAETDFEDDMYEFGSWLNVENTIDDFDWELYSSSASTQFGQIADNTLGPNSYDGHFALATNLNAGKYARLMSEIMQPVGDQSYGCIKFYYKFNDS